MSNRPGGELAKRPLHFFWIADCSSSMAGDNIQQLNYAISNSIGPMRDLARDNPNAQVLVRSLRVASDVSWDVSTPTPVETFTWSSLPANGETKMGQALEMVADQLKVPPMSDRALPPVLVLSPNGQPIDDLNAGLRALERVDWGKKTERIASPSGERPTWRHCKSFWKNAASDTPSKPTTSSNW